MTICYWYIYDEVKKAPVPDLLQGTLFYNHRTANNIKRRCEAFFMHFGPSAQRNHNLKASVVSLLILTISSYLGLIVAVKSICGQSNVLNWQQPSQTDSMFFNLK